MLPAHQLQGELAIPAHQHDPSASARLRRRARKRVTGMALPCAHNSARPHLPRTKVPLSLRNPAKRFPHARTRWRKHPCKKRGPGHCCWETTVFSLTEKTVVVLQQSFKYFVLPKALKPYKKLQKCQKLLAILGSEDTV
jgi:hypothetical protein